jgi:cell division protein FtsB
MRWIPLILAVLILLLQYPLWFGKGGWFKVWELSREVETQKQANLQARARNAVMDAEVRDLKQGTDAIEERARSELGMIRRGEVFIQVDDGHPSSAPVSVTAMAASAVSRPAASQHASVRPPGAK